MKKDWPDSMGEDGGEEGEEADEDEGPLVQVGVHQVVHVDTSLILASTLVKSGT